MKWRQHLADSEFVLKQMHDAPGLGATIATAAEFLVAAARARKPILVCGNGGSAADAMHFVAELTGRYGGKVRRPVKAIALPADPVFLTAWSNDDQFSGVFGRQVEAHGEFGGVLVVLTASGKSPNVQEALSAAADKGLTGIALTGAAGIVRPGAFGARAALEIRIPSAATPLIQQAHMVVLHHFADCIDRSLRDG